MTISHFKMFACVWVVFMGALLSSCVTHEKMDLIRVDYHEKFDPDTFRPVVKVTSFKFNRPYPKGFVRLDFQFSSRLEDIMDANNMLTLFADVKSCKTQSSIYSTPVFTSDLITDGFVYSVFLPYEFDKEVLQNDHWSIIEPTQVIREKFLNEGGCIQLGAGAMHGAILKSNRIKIFVFEPNTGELLWTAERAPVLSYCLDGWTDTAEGSSKVIQLSAIEQERYVKLLPEDRAYICAHSIGSSTYIVNSENSDFYVTRFINMVKIEEEVILAK